MTPIDPKQARAKLRKVFEEAPLMAAPGCEHNFVAGVCDVTWGDLLALAYADPVAEVTGDGSRVCPPGHMLLPQNDHEARVMNCVSERFIKSE